MVVLAKFGGQDVGRRRRARALVTAVLSYGDRGSEHIFPRCGCCERVAQSDVCRSRRS